MTLNRNTLAIALALAVLAGHQQAALAQVSAPAEGGDIKSVLERIGKMEKSLTKEMQEAFKNVAADIDNVKKQIGDLRDNLNGVNAKILALNIGGDKNDKRIETLEAELKNLNRLISQLEQNLAKASSSSYVAKSPPASTPSRVMLVNMYGEDMVFILNQKSYPIRANTSQLIDAVPSGALTYEVFSPTWGRRAFSTTTLPSGETLTLTAR